MDYQMLNGLVVKWLIRRKYAYKKTKETTNGSTKSYYEETKEKKESEEIMPRGTGYGYSRPMKKKKKKKKKKK